MEFINNQLGLWIGFSLFLILMLSIDIWFLDGGKAHKVSFKESLTWTIFWFVLAILFNLILWFYYKQHDGLETANAKALEFFTGYFLEKSLSIDNIFVFLMVFKYFHVPAELQKRVLLYGIIGAILMRFILIMVGIWLITKFHWILYIFGAFLLITGIKMFFSADKETNLNSNKIILWIKRYFKITNTYHGEKFFYKSTTNKGIYVTPLVPALILIEVTDLIFAVDSIPAIFAITQDPLIVFTSNMFAILGLRALYFCLNDLIEKFYYLKYGLALTLTFIGFKMLLVSWIKLPIILALGVIVAIMGFCIILSIYKNKKRGLS